MAFQRHKRRAGERSPSRAVICRWCGAAAGRQDHAGATGRRGGGPAGAQRQCGRANAAGAEWMSSSGRRRVSPRRRPARRARCWCWTRSRRSRAGRSRSALVGRRHAPAPAAQGGAARSAPLLVAQGLTESLAGASRSCACRTGRSRDARGLRLLARSILVLRWLSGRGAARPSTATLGALHRRQPHRNLDLARRSAAHRVDKPALLRRLFELACRYSGQALSYTQDARAVARRRQLHHAGALPRSSRRRGLVVGLQKYAGMLPEAAGPVPSCRS